MYPVTHQFGEPIVFFFLHNSFFFRWRFFHAGAGTGYFILLLFHMYTVVVIGVLLSLFSVSFLLYILSCVSFSVSPFLCVSFSVSFSLSPFLYLLFSVSPFLCLHFSVSSSLSPFLCLSIPLSVYCSLLLVSVIFSDSKNNPLLELFALLEFFPLDSFPWNLSPVELQSPVKILPLLEFSPCSAVFHFSVFPSSLPTYSYPFLSIIHPSIFPIITYYPKLCPSDNTLPDPPP